MPRDWTIRVPAWDSEHKVFTTRHEVHREPNRTLAQVVRGYRCFKPSLETRSFVDAYNTQTNEFMARYELQSNTTTYSMRFYKDSLAAIGIRLGNVESLHSWFLEGQTGYMWKAGRDQARCNRSRYGNPEKQTESAHQHLEAGTCTCGIWSYYSPWNEHVYRENYPILTVCRLWGSVVLADYGMRSEFAEVERIFLLCDKWPTQGYGPVPTGTLSDVFTVGKRLRSYYQVPVMTVFDSRSLQDGSCGEELPLMDYGWQTEKDQPEEVKQANWKMTLFEDAHGKYARVLIESMAKAGIQVEGYAASLLECNSPKDQVELVKHLMQFF